MAGRRRVALVSFTLLVLLLLGGAVGVTAAVLRGSAAPPPPTARDLQATPTPTPTPTQSPTTGRAVLAPLRVVGLGDSVPAADTCGCVGYLEKLATDLSATTRRVVSLHNDATSGWTTQAVLDDLDRGRSHDDLAAGADVVVVEIGANDFDLARLSERSCAPAGRSPCFGSTLARLRSGLTTVVDRVRGLAPGARVALVGYWNVGVDGSVGRSLGSTYVASSEALTREINRVVVEVSRDTGATYVDVYTPLKGTTGRRDPTEDLLEDGDHPNASGHARLAGAVLDALQASGSVSAWAR